MLPDLEALAVQDERLRQVARDPEAIERAIEQARHLLLEAADERERCRLHGYLGTAARLLGRDDEAVRELVRSVELADSLGDAQLRATATIRLAEAHRSFGRLDAAESLLRAALETGERRDFALQHLGKTLLDAGRRDEGVEVLEAALELRRAAGDPALVASTEQALALARRETD